MASAEVLPIGDHQNVAHFVTLNRVDLYGVYDPESTSVQALVDSLHDHYDCNRWNRSDFALYSDDLKRVLDVGDMETPVGDLGLGRVSRFTLRYVPHHGHYPPEGIIKRDEAYVEDLYQRTKEGNSYQIFVKTLAGRTINIGVTEDITGLDLKYLIQRKENVPADQQRLVLSGRQLHDDKTMEDMGVGLDMTVYLLLTLKAGMYNESTGRAGNYEPLKSNVFAIEPDLERAGVVLSPEGGDTVKGLRFWFNR